MGSQAGAGGCGVEAALEHTRDSQNAPHGRALGCISSQQHTEAAPSHWAFVEVMVRCQLCSRGSEHTGVMCTQPGHLHQGAPVQGVRVGTGSVGGEELHRDKSVWD